MNKANQLMILIEGMTIDQAFKVLGINSSNYKATDIKDIYRKLALKNHPDKGGDVNVMTQINLAYEMLKNSGLNTGSGSTDGDTYDFKSAKADTKKQDEIASKLVLRTLKNTFNSEIYRLYFEKMSGLKLEIDEQEGIDLDFYNRLVRLSYEFSIPSKETVFKFTIDVPLDRVNLTRSLGTGDGDVNFPYYVRHHVYHNKRKQKMKQKSWKAKSNVKDIVDPETLFPKATLEKVFAGRKQRKFSKRDFVEGIRRELKGVTQKDYMWIPVNKEGAHLVIHRFVFKRMAAWSLNGLYQTTVTNNRKKTNRIESLRLLIYFNKSNLLAENEVTLDFLIKYVNQMKKKSTLKDMAVFIETEAKKFTDERLRQENIGK